MARLIHGGQTAAALSPEGPMPEQSSAGWLVIRGESPTTRALDPGLHGLDIPHEVLTCADEHGLDSGDPDVYLVVPPAEEAEPTVTGEEIRRRFPLDSTSAAHLRDAWENAAPLPPPGPDTSDRHAARHPAVALQGPDAAVGR